MDGVCLAAIAACYLIGAIPSGLLLSRGSGVDIRQAGSRNIGATNVTRLLGKRLGILTLVADLLKGLVPLLAATALLRHRPQGELAIAACGAATVLGHMFPLYLRFRGGKGVATALGVFLALAPLSALLALPIFLATVGLSGFVSLASLLAVAALPVLLWLLGEPGWKIALGVVIAVLIWFQHRGNIARLLRGEEKGWKKSA
ncbi:MAG: acyl-phosphate glycerol 3-phosphate acyltransferase [Desulfobulbaceae bacterium A2]|nr:MAG: acyl-phosphate glycerol 3-phosphate acyltransferase [Desulfobulbaceae bacterium A2]